MVQFKGFETKAAAKKFVKETGRGILCYKRSKTEKRSKYPQDYRDCVSYGGLDEEKYPYAVVWKVAHDDSYDFA